MKMDEFEKYNNELEKNLEELTHLIEKSIATSIIIDFRAGDIKSIENVFKEMDGRTAANITMEIMRQYIGLSEFLDGFDASNNDGGKEAFFESMKKLKPEDMDAILYKH